MSIPIQCKDCKLEGAQLEMCTIRKYQFEALLKKCPKEIVAETRGEIGKTVEEAFDKVLPMAESEQQIKQENTEPEAMIDPDLDRQILVKLKRSAEQQGYLQKVIKDQNGNIISGRHRKAIDPNWAEESINVKDELDREIKIIHFNVQRRVPVDETADKLQKIARLFEQDGTPLLEVVPKMVNVLPYTEKWIRELLPDKYSERKHKIEQLLPEGQFDVIYADPPWQYDFSLSERGDPERHYPIMPTEDICSLKIPSAENSVLFLWATNPKLEDALQVMRAWGFEYRTNMVWIKDKFGIGYYFRGQHELLLVGKKGELPIPKEANRFPSVLQSPVKEHSEKPEEVYNIIETMYPEGKYLELFARKEREKWKAWGNEVKES